MASLWEIDQEILSLVDAETGEIVDVERLDELQLERNTKIKKVAQWHQNLINDSKAFKEMAEQFSKKQKSAERKAQSLKEWLDYALQGAKFEADDKSVSISYRKSETVEIADEEKIIATLMNIGRDDLLTFRTPTPNKTEIKRALKDGVEIEGVKLVTKSNIQIK